MIEFPEKITKIVMSSDGQRMVGGRWEGVRGGGGGGGEWRLRMLGT